MKRIMVLSSCAVVCLANSPESINMLAKLDVTEHQLSNPRMHYNIGRAVTVGIESGATSLGLLLLGIVARGVVLEKKADLKVLLIPVICAVVGSGYAIKQDINHYNDAKTLHDAAQGLDLAGAAAHDNEVGVKNLLQLGHNPLWQDERDRTPLMYASAAGAAQAAALLLAAMKPQVVAQQFGITKKVVSVDVQDMFGRTAAHYAALNNQPALLKTLIREHGASINIPDNNGTTVAMLIEKNADLQEMLN